MTDTCRIEDVHEFDISEAIGDGLSCSFIFGTLSFRALAENSILVRGDRKGLS